MTMPRQDAGAYYTYTCKVCGDIYVENYNSSFEGNCEGISWTIEDDQLFLSGSGAMCDFTSPAFDLENKAPWYGYRNLFSDIVIQRDITSIGDYAFYDVDNLTYVMIPESVTQIGEGALRLSNSLSVWNMSIPM